MNKLNRSQYIRNTLDRIYPETPIPLNSNNTFQLLVAVLLSAQCTDERVNKVTPGLFKLGSTPHEMTMLPVERIYNTIKSCGLAPKKAKAISALSKIYTDVLHT